MLKAIEPLPPRHAPGPLMRRVRQLLFDRPGWQTYWQVAHAVIPGTAYSPYNCLNEVLRGLKDAGEVEVTQLVIERRLESTTTITAYRLSPDDWLKRVRKEQDGVQVT